MGNSEKEIISDPKVDFEPLLARDDLAVSKTVLKPGGEIPWHRHSEVTDCFTAVSGVIEVQIDGGEPVRLRPGEQTCVPARRGHRVVNVGEGDAGFVLVQTGGTNDFIPI